MNFNKVLLGGRLTRDPESKELPNGTAVCDIGLAVNDRVKNKQTGEYEDRANFIDCTAFGKTAESLARFFTKGRPIFIEGKARFESWDDRETGKKRSKIKVIVDTWQFCDSKDAAGAGGGSGATDYARPAAPQADVTVPDDGDIPF